MTRERLPWLDIATLAALAGGLTCVVLLAEMLSARGAAPGWFPFVVQVSAGALAAGTIASLRDERKRGLAAQLALWLIVAGALGGAVWMAVVATELLRGEPRPLFAAEIDAEIDDDPIEALAAIAASIEDRRVRLEGASAIQPLRNVLAEASTANQLRALAALAQNYTPGIAHALELALTSPETSVRVLAATALVKLHQTYGAQIDARAAKPPATPAQWVALGQARLAFALSGLLNDDRRSTVLEQAEAAFATGLSLDDALAPAQAGCATSRRARRPRPLVSTSPQPRPRSASALMRPVQ